MTRIEKIRKELQEKKTPRAKLSEKFDKSLRAKFSPGQDAKHPESK